MVGFVIAQPTLPILRAYRGGLRATTGGAGGGAGAVPEPGSLALLGVGMLGLVATARRRRDHA